MVIVFIYFINSFTITKIIKLKKIQIKKNKILRNCQLNSKFDKIFKW